ncbi:hypothetical protein [Nocardia bovistercoris]|uniref:Uncharacterized protein n=1 Tax=Nocardia bovistercoris TaxID=2785916 RepID=A0A931IA62_9NOCA|nr:hypothetical protein [Nocardia bovistercoris]MBH0777689.1 hypothetical protein [Nocardia bovistercoris]
MFDLNASATIAAALHTVFATSPHAPDSLEMWLDVTAEATRRLSSFPAPTGVSWLPVFTSYRWQRTDAEYHLPTTAVRITSGRLAGLTYTDPDTAARAVVTAYPTPAPDTDPDDDGGVVELSALVPTWRLPAVAVPAPLTEPATVPAATR